MYVLYYNNQCIGTTNAAPIIGDDIMGYYVWAVDYHRHIAWLCK